MEVKSVEQYEGQPPGQAQGGYPAQEMDEVSKPDPSGNDNTYTHTATRAFDVGNVGGGAHCPGSCSALGGLLYAILLYVWTTGSICFIVYCNFEVGYAFKWGLSFLINFLGIPLLFLPTMIFFPYIPMRPSWMKKWFVRVFVCIGLFYSMAIGFPVALTANRMATADRFSATVGPLHVDANCWAHPTPKNGADNWNKEVTYIHWGDADWYIDRSRIAASYYVYGSTAHTFAAAPIQLRSTSPMYPYCSGYRAFALCYCAHTSSNLSPCTESEQNSLCAWDLAPSDVLSRVVRKESFYKAYSDNTEYDGYVSAVGRVSAPWPHPDNHKPLMLWWATDQTPDFFQRKGTDLASSLHSQLMAYAIFWCVVGAFILLVYSCCASR